MAIRYLVAALLVGGAFSANAGVLPLAVGNPSYATTAGGNALVGVYNGRRVAVAGGTPSQAVSAPAPAASTPAVLPPAPVVYAPAPAAAAPAPVVTAPPQQTSGGSQGNGAIVTLPTGAGNQGPAVVQLPIPAQAAHGGGDVGQAPPPVTLPSGPAAAVPEPSSIALMMAGMLGGLGVARRRKR